MKKSERASIVRVLIDLIKADSVIDEGEMALYAKLKHDYNISREDEISASSMTLSDAVMTLVDSSSELRNSLMEVFSDMTVSDGFCAAQEAQLMLALIYCLKDVKTDIVHTGIPEIAGVIATAVSYKLKHNTFLSIILGTACCMVLMHFM